MPNCGVELVELQILMHEVNKRWVAVVDLTDTDAANTPKPLALISAMQACVVGFWQASLVLAKLSPAGQWAFEGADEHKQWAQAHQTALSFHLVKFVMQSP